VEIGCVFIHGLTGTPWALQELEKYLARRNIAVSAPFLPGHGTDPRDLLNIPWETWVHTCRREVENLHRMCENIFLLGFSMGGSIALILASELPIQGVISLSAPVMLRNPMIRLLPLMRPFVRYWKKKGRGSPDSYPLERGYDRYPIASVTEFMKLLHRARSRLTEVRCPALIMHAQGDRRVPDINAEIIYQNIGSKEKYKILLEAPCHNIARGENRQKVAEEVFRFIRNHSE